MSTPEQILKHSICDYLAIRYRGQMFFWVQESVGIWDSTRKIFKNKRGSYQRNGIPDILGFIIIESIPVWFGFEVKTRTGRQSPNQKLFQRDAERLGGFYFIVRSLDDVLFAITQINSKITKIIGDKKWLQNQNT